MMEEYVKEGLKMELAENIYESYGTHLRDLKVVGHPILINNFEDFIENMRWLPEPAFYAGSFIIAVNIIQDGTVDFW